MSKRTRKKRNIYNMRKETKGAFLTGKGGKKEDEKEEQGGKGG